MKKLKFFYTYIHIVFRLTIGDMNRNYSYEPVENRYKDNLLTEWDKCGECEVRTAKEICKNCGDCVCKRKTCAEIFPHKENENFTICKTCADKIGEKLKISINHDELRLLKQKITIKLQNKVRSIEKFEE